MKYEYKPIETLNLGEREMNLLGQDGWELVCHDNYQHCYIFKRSLENK